MPATSGVDAGTIARAKPSRCASASRRPICGTWRTSPPSPSSPITTVSAATGDVVASRSRSPAPPRGRRPARPPSLRPPHSRRCLPGERDARALLHDRDEHREPAAVERLRDAARHRRRRLRRPAPAPRRTADACLRAPPRRPSPTRRPAGRRGTARSGRRPAASPSPVISISPSSSVGPKRCFNARSMRSAWCRSPSNESTVSTTCSSVRGPASEPSLVT